ncbi:MAG: alanine racemase [Sphingomonadales bacterium]|nr:alanine racemase [Sphingomonadales bacterium]NCQ20934.1 alanine racemase [Sphingomonadales bacterium]NCT02692.1 alanine racemase [Sphingomonadales bacterium]
MIDNAPVGEAALAGPPLPPPSLRLGVDKAALAANWKALDRLSGSARAGAAVKADCYGLGAATCVPVLRDAGCETFFVAHWSEVPDVIAHVPGAQVAVLHGVSNQAECAYARAVGAVPVINSVEQAALWSTTGGGRCHLMLDTGINRLGIAPGEAGDTAIGGLAVDLLMSHLASADENTAMNRMQAELLGEAADAIPHQRLSLANSAGIALGNRFTLDVTRPGLALYGGVPREELADVIRPVVRVAAQVLQCRQLAPGDGVGYNSAFIANSHMRVGTVSMGYADGFLRGRGPGNALWHEARRLPILGKVSMDMVVVDLTTAPDLAAGDWLEVPWNIADAAQQNALSPYEMLTVLGARLRRI